MLSKNILTSHIKISLKQKIKSSSLNVHRWGLSNERSSYNIVMGLSPCKGKLAIPPEAPISIPSFQKFWFFFFFFFCRWPDAILRHLDCKGIRGYVFLKFPNGIWLRNACSWLNASMTPAHRAEKEDWIFKSSWCTLWVKDGCFFCKFLDWRLGFSTGKLSFSSVLRLYQVWFRKRFP